MFDEDVLIGESLGIPMPKNYPPSNLLITDDHVGVEIELERAHGIALRTKTWTKHNDGSLRNQGMEFVFANPLNGSGIITALDDIEVGCKLSHKDHGIEVSISDRTSVHVHVNVLDLTRPELSKMILLYSIFELPFFKAFGPSRLQKHFCIPYNDLVELIGVPRWLHQGFDVFSNNVNTPNVGRYCAFNLKSVFKFGTIEFRHHAGEYFRDPLLLYINGCLSFKRGGKSEINLRETFFEASDKGFDEPLRHIFPRDVAEAMLATYNGDMKAFNRDVIRGIRCAQHATLAHVRI